MSKKLNSILLIDDDEATNFIHQMVIQDHGVACDQIIIKTNGEEALSYLSTPNENGKSPNPDIIFLDINMPRLDGWGFLEQYQALYEQPPSRVIVMLTTSLNKYDQERAANTSLIATFRNKPLSGEMLEEILQKYFVQELSVNNS